MHNPSEGGATTPFNDLAAALARVAPAGLVIAGGPLDVADGDEIIEEEGAVRNAVPSRRREFRAGRLYARAALSRLGLSPSPIPVGPSRAPIWPMGVVGSISHTSALCAVAAAPAAAFLGVGVDIEDAAPLSDDLTRLVALGVELSDRARLEKSLGHDLPKLLFVVKEAFYKMYFPLAQRVLEFHEVAVDLDAGGACARVTVHAPGAPAVAGRRSFDGRFGWCDGTLFAVFALPAPPGNLRARDRSGP